MKLYTKAMGTKTQNLIINLEDDESKWYTDDDKTLADYGCGKFIRLRSIITGKLTAS